MLAGDLAPDLQPPRRHVHPTNAFVRFEREWLERSIPECFADRASRRHADSVAIIASWIDSPTGSGKPSSPQLRLIQLGGEAMFAKDVERFKKHFGAHCLLMVGLGTAESGHVFEFSADKDTECPTDLPPVDRAQTTVCPALR